MYLTFSYMKRLRLLTSWLLAAVTGCGVLALCMAVAFWDSVVLGRNFDEQMSSSEDAPRT